MVTRQHILLCQLTTGSCSCGASSTAAYVKVMVPRDMAAVMYASPLTSQHGLKLLTRGDAATIALQAYASN